MTHAIMAKASAADCIRAHELWKTIYHHHLAGCCWHIVLDDFNLGDDSVEFCVRYAKESEWCDTRGACLEIGPILLRMSKTQRRKLAKGEYAALYEQHSARSQ